MRNNGKLKSNVSGWVLMLPTLVLFVFFIWLPLAESVRLSFHTAKGMRIESFIGFSNYKDIWAHPDFGAAVRNTFLYLFWSLVLGFWTPLVIAGLITEAVRFKGFFRSSVYFPNILPGIASIMIWGFFFKSGKDGVLNIVLSWFGAEPMVWLSNRHLTIPLIVLMMTWKSAGSTALIYMASMAGISLEQYEAAAIDGAGPFRRFFSITLPGILNLGKTLLILQIIAVFQILYEPLVLTNGGPNNASSSLMHLVFRYAFQDFNYPKAAAVSVIISVILTAMTLIYFRITRNVDNSG